MKLRGLLMVNGLIAAMMAGFALWVAAGLAPGAELPVHWNAAGDVDRFAPALTALLWPAGASLALGVLFAAIPRLEPLQHRLEGSAALLRSAWIGIILLMVFVQLMIAAPALGWNIGPDLLLVGIGALLVMVGDSLPKSRPGFSVGIRTPWTISDTDNWIATHRLGGKIMIGAGCLMVLAAFTPVPPEARIAAVLGLTSITVLVPVFYSWWLWRSRAR